MRTSFVLLVLGVGLAGCGSGDLTLPSDGAPAKLTLISGDGQEATAGSRLPDPLVVEVTDSRGRPVEGASVQFSFDGDVSGGDLTPETATTGSDGRGSAAVRLGSTEGAQVVQARLGDGGSGLEARFQLTATRPDNGGGDGGGGGGHGHGGSDGGGSVGGGGQGDGGGDQASGGGSGGDGGGGDSSQDGSKGGSNHDSHDNNGGGHGGNGGGGHGGGHGG